MTLPGISVRQRELRRQIEQCEQYLNTHVNQFPGSLTEHAVVEVRRHLLIVCLASVQAEEYDPS